MDWLFLSLETTEEKWMPLVGWLKLIIKSITAVFYFFGAVFPPTSEEGKNRGIISQVQRLPSVSDYSHYPNLCLSPPIPIVFITPPQSDISHPFQFAAIL